MKKKEDMTPEEIEAIEKPNWFNAETVTVEKLVVETALNNTDDLRRIRFETKEFGDITYKPKKTKTEIRKVEGVTFETPHRDTYTLGDLKNDFPAIMALAKVIEKTPQEIVISFCKKAFYNEQDKVYIDYQYCNDGQAKTIYFEPFHKDDKSNIDKQQERKKRFAESSL